MNNNIINEAIESIHQLMENEQIRQQCVAREEVLRKRRIAADLESALQEKLDSKNMQSNFKEKQLTIKDEQLTAKDKQLAFKNEEIAALKAQLAQFTKQ